MGVQTATISLGEFFQPSESTVLAGLRRELIGLKILKVDRPFLSGRFIVTFDNELGFSESNLYTAFMGAMDRLGYEGGEVINIERGKESSDSGGISGIVDNVQDGTVTAMKTSILPLTTIAVAAVAIAAIYLGPQILKGMGGK